MSAPAPMKKKILFTVDPAQAPVRPQSPPLASIAHAEQKPAPLAQAEEVQHGAVSEQSEQSAEEHLSALPQDAETSPKKMNIDGHEETALVPVDSGSGGDDGGDGSDKEEEEEEEEPDDRPMSLRDHLRELRKRLLYSFIFIMLGFFVFYHFAQPIFEFLMLPLVKALPEGIKLQYKAPAEAFFALMKVSMVASLLGTSPLVFYQIWAFIAPGLHKEEKLWLLPVAFFSAACFVSGAAFCYYIAFPFIFQFLMSFNSPITESRPAMEDSLSFALRLIVAFGFIFELPLFTFFLARLGIVTAAWMRQVRRYAILFSFILAAILSPPEVMSMLLMTGPLLVLYEISILIAAAFGKKKPKPEPEEEEDDEDDDEEETADAGQSAR